MTYFPFTDYWWFYLTFSVCVLLLLALDLGVFHSTSKTRVVPRSGELVHRLDRIGPGLQLCLLSIRAVDVRA